LLIPNKWYDIKIRVEKGITTYSVNGEELFRLPVKENEGDGYFGLRLLENHTLFKCKASTQENTELKQYSTKVTYL